MTAHKQKIVFQTNHELVLIGTCLADESPLEPGVWMIPGGCVELEPPEIPPGKRARYSSGSWVIEPVPPEVVEPEVEAPAAIPLAAQIKSAAQAYMDQTAQLNGYESLLAAISYAEEDAVEAFQLEGKRFRAWRSLVWAYVFAQLAYEDAFAELESEEPDHELNLLEVLQGLPELEGEHARIDLENWPYLNPVQ